MMIAAAGAIVFDDVGRLLLVRRGRPPQAGFWSVPGGKCEPGESAEAACVRECTEETGLLVTVVRPAGRVVRAATSGSHYVIDDYVCTVTGGRAVADDDAVELKWVDRAEFDAMSAGGELVDGLDATLTGWGLGPR